MTLALLWMHTLLVWFRQEITEVGPRRGQREERGRREDREEELQTAGAYEPRVWEQNEGPGGAGLKGVVMGQSAPVTMGNVGASGRKQSAG